MTDFLDNTTFRWSSFDTKFDIIPKDGDYLGYEYATPEQADSLIKIEDGEIAWDLGTTNYPGPPIRKILVGVYASDAGFVAGKWDKDRKDLVGCATVKDWEWDRYVGYEDEEDKQFTEELVLARLEYELDILNEHEQQLI